MKKTWCGLSKFLFVLLLPLSLFLSCQSEEKQFEGTWRAPHDSIVVKLNASTKLAEITITLGEFRTTYTSSWEVVKGKGALFNDNYVEGQYSIIGYDGELYTFNSFTGRLTDNEIKMAHSK